MILFRKTKARKIFLCSCPKYASMEHKPGFDSFTGKSQPERTPWSFFIVQFSSEKLILINSDKIFLKTL